jgi:type I restriction enzyme S subunit
MSVADYQEIPLGALCELTAGPSGSLLENLYEGPDGVPVIAPPDLTEQHTVDTRRLRRISWADAEKLSRFSVREGDVLFVRQGTLGRLALMGAEHATWLYSSACLRMRPRRELVMPAYLAAYLSYEPVQKDMLSQALPGTVPSLNTALFYDFPITVPAMQQQQTMVATLADIDAQVRIQRKIASRLEILGQAIFGEMLHERGRT